MLVRSTVTFSSASPDKPRDPRDAAVALATLILHPSTRSPAIGIAHANPHRARMDAVAEKVGTC
jgi:hypothetical protein